MQEIPDIRVILRIPWVLVGGIALRAYIPERMTLDVDILVHEHHATVARDSFTDAGYTVVGQLRIGGFTVAHATQQMQSIDVLTRDDPWVEAALQHPHHDAAGFPVLDRRFLILMKIQSGRTQDLGDIQRLIAHTSLSERATTRQIIEQYSVEFVEDYELLCTLADLEFGPPSE